MFRLLFFRVGFSEHVPAFGAIFKMPLLELLLLFGLRGNVEDCNNSFSFLLNDVIAASVSAVTGLEQSVVVEAEFGAVIAGAEKVGGVRTAVPVAFIAPCDFDRGDFGTVPCSCLGDFSPSTLLAS
jgi:hypothetical protein